MSRTRLENVRRQGKIRTSHLNVLLGLTISFAGLTCARQIPDTPEVYLTALTIRPQDGDDILLVDNNANGVKDFLVNAFFSDGHQEDFTNKVTWELESQLIGAFRGATFLSKKSPSPNVLFTEVYARYNEGGRILVGKTHLTIVWLQRSGSKPDIFFRLPYEGPSDSKKARFTTNFQQLDVLTAVDTTDQTGNGFEIKSFSNSFTAPQGIGAALAKLISTERPQRVGVMFGLGAFDDYPVIPHGSACPPRLDGHPTPDQPWTLLQPIGPAASVGAALPQLLWMQLPRGCGSDKKMGDADLPQSHLDALFQIATGDGLRITSVGVDVPAHKGELQQPPQPWLGGVEFRRGSLPVVAMLTDSSFHTSGGDPTDARTCKLGKLQYADPLINAVASSRQRAIGSLDGLFAKFVGLSTVRSGFEDDCLATKDLRKTAMALLSYVPPSAWGEGGTRPSLCSEGQCCTGLGGRGEPTETGRDGEPACPLVYLINGDDTGISPKAGDLPERMVNGVDHLINHMSFDALANVEGKALPLDGNPNSSAFIKRISPDPTDTQPSPKPVQVMPQARVAESGYSNVVPGSLLGFEFEARNDIVPGAETPQVFYLTVRLRAGVLTEARRRDCFERQKGCADLDQRRIVILVPPTTPS